MPRQIRFLHPNKMDFQSGFVAFDRQTTLIRQGSFYGPTQASTLIRRGAYDLDEYKHREVQAFDLDTMRIYGLTWPRQIDAYYAVDAFPVDHHTYLYLFFHERNERLTLDGYAITDEDHVLIQYGVTGRTYKSRNAVHEALSYILCGTATITKVDSFIDHACFEAMLIFDDQVPTLFEVDITMPYTIEHCDSRETAYLMPATTSTFCKTYANAIRYIDTHGAVLRTKTTPNTLQD